MTSDTQHETIKLSRSFPAPRSVVFHHWTDPVARQRWEAGPETGMQYDAFDTRTGGQEIVRVTHEGNEVGHMVQKHVLFLPDTRLVTHVIGIFGGEPTMTMQLVMTFHEVGNTECRIDVVAQVIDLTGRAIREEHENGWAWMFDRFADDLAAHGQSKP